MGEERRVMTECRGQREPRGTDSKTRGLRSRACLESGWSERLEGFESEALRLRADGDKGDEGVGAGTEDGEVVGGFVDDEKHGRLFIGIRGSEAHRRGRRADSNGFGNAPIEDVNGSNASGSTIGDVHTTGVVREDSGRRRGTKQHGVRDFVRPSIDDLQAVSGGRDDVEFAAIGLEEHLSGRSGEFEVGDENRVEKVDDGEAGLRAGHHESKRRIRGNENFVRLGNDRHGGEELKSTRVVDGEGISAAINDDDIPGIGRDAGLNGLGESVSAAIDLVGSGIDGDELIGIVRGGEDAIAGGREIERKGRVANGNAGELVGRRAEDEEAIARSGRNPDLVSFRVFAQIGNRRSEGELVDNLETGEIDGGEGIVGRGNVGIHVQVGAEKGRAVFAEENNDG